MLRPAWSQMRPQLRRPPPGATDVLAALAPWFPKGFAPSRAVSLHMYMPGAQACSGARASQPGLSCCFNHAPQHVQRVLIRTTTSL